MFWVSWEEAQTQWFAQSLTNLSDAQWEYHESKRVFRQSGLWELSGDHCVQSLETGVWVSPAGEDGRVDLSVGSVGSRRRPSNTSPQI